MKSWGHESSAACNLRRRCDLRARIRARAPTSAARASSYVLPLVSLSSASGRRERVRSPASLTGRDSTLARSAVVVSGTQQSSVAPSDVEPEARGFQLIRSTTRVRLLISIPWMACSLVGVISTWESWRVECHHIFKVKKSPSSTNFTCSRWSKEYRDWSSMLPITVGRQTVSLPVCFIGSFMIFHSGDEKGRQCHSHAIG